MSAFAAVFLALGSALQLASSQTGVCTRSVASTQTYTVSVSVSSSYTYDCGIFDWSWKRCSGTRYHSQAEQHTCTIYHTEQTCCSGYSGDGNQCSPICDDCDHVCEAPNTCVCPAGWTGEDCLEDIDECQSGVCEHNCTNNEGSYQCICPDGSVLEDDQTSCIESPQNVMLTAVNSTSLNFTWEPPQLGEMDGDLSQFSVTCSPIEYLKTILFAHRRSFIYRSLSPYTLYTCCVTAVTTNGTSSPACDTETTLEDVPSGAPENVTVTVVTPFAVDIRWTPPAVPNGNIVSYTVYSSGTPVVNASGSEENYLLDGLSPYQEISVSVSASTMIGEGPQSEQKTTRTHQTVPSAVESVQVKALSPNLLHVMWGPPLSPNGVITGYVVQVSNLSSSAQPFIVVVPPNEYQVNISDGVEPYVPYAVSVSANNSAGVGEAVEVIVFTLDGIPRKGPTIVSADRTEATAALVEWELLSLEDLRGNFSSYEVVYYDLLEEQCPAQASTDNETVSVIRGDLHAVIAGLDPGLRYCVAVAAKTSVGVGEFSHRVIPLFTNSVFTVTLVEVQNCTQWILEMPSEKAMDLVQGISAGIEQFCRCQFPGDYIGDEKLMCDLEAIHTVVFQGRIISTNDRDSSDLVGDLDEWVSTEPTVVVQGELLQVVKSETQPNSSSEDSQLSSAVVGAVVVVLVLVLLLLITVIGVTIVYIRWRKLSKAKVDLTSHAAEGSLTASDAVLKELDNPFYGYGTREPGVSEAVYQQVPEELKELTNPTYGTAEPPTPPEKVVPNPMYLTTPQRTASTPSGGEYNEVPVSTSNRGEYSEVPAHMETPIYDAPAKD